MALIKNKRKTLRTKKTKGKKLRKKNIRRKSINKIKRGGAFFEDSLPDDLKKGEMLGSGAWGKVYIATWNENSEEKVGVVKVSKSHGESHYKINLHEVEILKYLTERENRITCPSNISIYGYKRYDDKRELEILMEYFSGVELFELQGRIDFSNEKGKLAWNSIKNQLVNAVNCLHNLNVVHRDIKPENIMISMKTLDIKMIDFGFACHKEGEELQKTCDIFVGTRWYISPELYMFYVNKEMRRLGLRGPYTEFENITWEMLIAADIWALGMTLYTLAYGKKLFEFYFDKDEMPYSADEIKRNLLQIGRKEKDITYFISHELSYKDNIVLFPIILPLLEVDVSKRINNFKTLVETIQGQRVVVPSQ